MDLAIEPMHPGCAADWTYLTELTEALELLTSYDSPHLKLAFDTYHLCQNGSVTPILSEIASRIAIVQLGDAREPPHGEPNRAALGEGKLPLVEVVKTLQAAGYSGYYDVELMGDDIEQTKYKDLVTQ